MQISSAESENFDSGRDSAFGQDDDPTPRIGASSTQQADFSKLLVRDQPQQVVLLEGFVLGI